MSARRDWLRDALLVAACSAFFIWPIFKTKYYDNWGTIDSTFIADGRYLSENLPHPGWLPLWYGGTRFDYIYPPAIRYGTALLTKALPIIPARAYHLYTAIFYVVGIAAVYLLVRLGSGSRHSALLSAAGAAFLSPTFLALTQIRKDVSPYMPQRLNALVRYGEGPHMTAFALLPLALFLAWRGLRPGYNRWLAGSALVCAAVVANNFYGATALAFFFPLLCWAVFVETRDYRVWLRGAFIAALSYGLTAVWLTPSFVKITTRNLALVSHPGKPWSVAVLVIVLALWMGITWVLARKNKCSAWTAFVSGSALTYSLVVLGNYYFDFRVAGEPVRLVPEADLCLVLLGVLLIRKLWLRFPSRASRIALAALVLLCFLPVRRYIFRPWHHLTRTSEVQHLVEYKVPAWIDQHRPGTRTYATGTVRFWWNVWFNGAQIGGGSEQGLENFLLPHMFWQTTHGTEADADKLWYQAFGVDNVIVNDESAKLIYKDFLHPHKYQGQLPVLWEDGRGNWIYEVPRKHGGLARVVRTEAYSTVGDPLTVGARQALEPYVAMLEDGTTPAATSRWLDTDTLEIEAETRPGDALAVQVTYDEFWRARENGQEYTVAVDKFGQMRVDLPPGRHRLIMHFDTPTENRIGQGISILSLGFVCILLVNRRRTAGS